MHKKMFHRAIGALACILAFSQLSVGSAVAAEGSEHIPGTAGYGDIVPADLLVPAGSVGADPDAVPDAQGNVPHICAGKKLLHHSHVDAAYATHLGGKLRMTVVDGRSVVEDPNSVCIRLAPDARSSDGQEVSRMVIPHAPMYSFLGKPGDIIWRAPQEQIDDWRPIWAGIGAFDTAHEVTQPQGIVRDEINLQLVSKRGPGAVEVWSTAGASKLNRGFSSETKLNPLVLGAGSHGHWNWTFSQAGVYHIGIVASYVDEVSNHIVTSPASDTIWLVGSDEQVGLPAGTTMHLSPIQQTAEDVRQALIDSGKLIVETDSAQNQSQTPAKEWTRAEACRAMVKLMGWESRIASAPSAPQKITYSASFSDDNGSSESGTSVKIDLLNNGKKIDDKPVIEVPDSLRMRVSESAGDLYQDAFNGEIWVLPPEGANGSLNFDFTQMPAEKRSDSIMYYVNYTERPDGSRYLAGEFVDDKLQPRLDTNMRPNREFTDDAVVTQLSHVFTQPGLYNVGFSVETKDAQGKSSYDSRDAVFVVGNASIDAVREITWERAKKENPEAPEPIYLGGYPGADNTTGENTIGGQSSGATDSQNTDGAVGSSYAAGGIESENQGEQAASFQQDVHLPQNNFTVITQGHMDQAVTYDGKNLRAFLDDTANPKKPVVRESGTFGYAVPSVTFEKIPADAVGFEKLRDAAPDGVWSLPETQLDGIPWVGFSTQRIDYSMLAEPGVTVKLDNFAGPGVMITGQNTLIDGFVTRLDSTNLQKTIEYRVGSHDHQAFYFTKEGNYRADFVYTMHLKDGRDVKQTLRAYFIVGDNAIAAARSGAAHETERPSDRPDSEYLGKQPLPIDELVKQLNARAGDSLASALGAASDGKLIANETPSSSKTSDISRASEGVKVTTSNLEPISNIGGKTDGFGNYGTQVGTAVLDTLNNGVIGSEVRGVGGASGLGDEIVGISLDSSSEDGVDDGAVALGSGDKVKSLKAVGKPSSSLLNPRNGAARAEKAMTPWWQWGLLGIAVVGVLGAVAFAAIKADRRRRWR